MLKNVLKITKNYRKKELFHTFINNIKNFRLLFKEDDYKTWSFLLKMTNPMINTLKIAKINVTEIKRIIEHYINWIYVFGELRQLN